MKKDKLQPGEQDDSYKKMLSSPLNGQSQSAEQHDGTSYHGSYVGSFLLNYKKGISSYLAGGSAAVLQVSTLHPLDTIAKRLQQHEKTIFLHSNFKRSMNNLYSVLWPETTSSLWRGYKIALSHRLMTSTLTFGSQRLLKELLEEKFGDTISQSVGKKYTSTATHALSGIVLGNLEVLLLPVDTGKVMRQTMRLDNGKPIPLFTLGRLLLQNGIYTGASVTSLRNTFSFATLFGASAMWKQRYFSPDSQITPTFYQSVLSSSVAAVGAVIVSNPFDMVKTRVQAELPTVLREPNSQSPIMLKKTAIGIAVQIYSKEGVYGFFRGILPRFGSIGPRLALLKAGSDWLAPRIDKGLEPVVDYYGGAGSCSQK